MTNRRGIEFEKWEGLGNDFIIVELNEPLPQPFDPERTRHLCDRHRGIGADGILFIDRSGPVPRMIVANADGSRPEMCGNGLGCAAAFIASTLGTPRELVIATDAGNKQCAAQGSHNLFTVTIDMGTAHSTGPLEALVAGKMHTFTTINVGNPHAVTFEPAYCDSDVDRIAPAIATSIPGGTNVEFCRISQHDARPRIDVVVWERGVGRTLACGTGACAVALAACETQGIPFGSPIDVALPGGILEITVDATRNIRMEGPARRVFRGEVIGP